MHLALCDVEKGIGVPWTGFSIVCMVNVWWSVELCF
jgi:hypothetical protein